MAVPVGGFGGACSAKAAGHAVTTGPPTAGIHSHLLIPPNHSYLQENVSTKQKESDEIPAAKNKGISNQKVSEAPTIAYLKRVVKVITQKYEFPSSEGRERRRRVIYSRVFVTRRQFWRRKSEPP